MKTAVVTGVTSGIGAAISDRLKKEDWRVIGLTRSELDLTDLEAVAQKGEAIAQEYPVLDALIHVAGIWHDNERVFADIDLEDFDTQTIADTMQVGVTSFMVLTAKLLPSLAKDGAVFGVSGTFGSGASGWLPYYVSKRAQEDFLVGLAQDYPHGPRVYGISPADTATPQYEKYYPEYAATAQPAAVIADVMYKVLVGKAKYETGTVIEVRDGVASKGFHV